MVLCLLGCSILIGKDIAGSDSLIKLKGLDDGIILVILTLVWPVLYISILNPAEIPWGMGTRGTVEYHFHRSILFSILGFPSSLLFLMEIRSEKRYIFNGAMLGVLAVQYLLFVAFFMTPTF